MSPDFLKASSSKGLPLSSECVLSLVIQIQTIVTLLFFIKNSLASITFMMIFISHKKSYVLVGMAFHLALGFFLPLHLLEQVLSLTLVFFFFLRLLLLRGFFFGYGPFFKKSLLNLLQYCFCFMFWLFSHEACDILTPNQGSNPIPCIGR